MELLLTLGHNSSAILVSKGEVINGYEEERLSKVKADSSYPKLAIEKIIEYNPECLDEVVDVCISHWFDSGTNLAKSKYYDAKHIAARFPEATVNEVSGGFTHHDAHANSVWNFSGYSSGLTIVCDGFGTDGETLSVYRDGRAVHRARTTSLGLMYQYTTAYLGMKENQDEYKMLGLESSVTEEDALMVEPFIAGLVRTYVSNMLDYNSQSSAEDCVEHNRVFVNSMLNMSPMHKYDKNSAEFKTVTAYAMQSVLERTMLELLSNFYEGDRILQFSGGVFMNVKLNNVILNRYADRVSCIEFHPLCGDQGAALGMTDVKYATLNFGKREFSIVEEVEGFEFVVKGNMEFGPRALGNTSCLAKPTTASTERINALNGRPTIMPMAPQISEHLADKWCRNINVLGRCKHFMIVATDWLGPIEEFRGVLHNKPCSSVYTCRPQVIYTVEDVVRINTSLNAHGQPIIYDELDYNKMKGIHNDNL